MKRKKSNDIENAQFGIRTPLRKRNVTAADTVKYLKKNGKEITEKQGQEIVDFLYFLAELAVAQYLKDPAAFEPDDPEC
jgi:hypothetical protein